MKGLTFEQLMERKLIAYGKENFDLAARLLAIIKIKFPVEYAFHQKKNMYNKYLRKKRGEMPVFMYKNLTHSLIRCGGKPIDVKFMEQLFAQ